LFLREHLHDATMRKLIQWDITQFTGVDEVVSVILVIIIINYKCYKSLYMLNGIKASVLVIIHCIITITAALMPLKGYSTFLGGNRLI